MNPIADEKVKNLLNQFSPQSRKFIEEFMKLQVENKMLKRENEALKYNYDDTFACLMAILNSAPKKELFIRDQDFKELKNEYRIQNSRDEKHSGRILKLLTIHDEIE